MKIVSVIKREYVPRFCNSWSIRRKWRPSSPVLRERLSRLSMLLNRLSEMLRRSVDLSLSLFHTLSLFLSQYKHFYMHTLTLTCRLSRSRRLPQRSWRRRRTHTNRKSQTCRSEARRGELSAETRLKLSLSKVCVCACACACACVCGRKRGSVLKL